MLSRSPLIACSLATQTEKLLLSTFTFLLLFISWDISYNYVSILNDKCKNKPVEPFATKRVDDSIFLSINNLIHTSHKLPFWLLLGVSQNIFYLFDKQLGCPLCVWLSVPNRPANKASLK